MPADPLPAENAASGAANIGKISAHGEILNVSLDKVEPRERDSVAEKIAQQDADLREWTATRIVWTFVGSNIVTLLALGTLVWLDEQNMRDKLIGPGDRIVTEHVIMTLLGATTVQVGAIAVIIARYLFPGQSLDT